MMLSLLLIGIIILLNNASATCGYVDIKGTVEYGGYPLPIGEFTLSTDRCQALHAELNVPGLGTYTVDGAMQFQCDPTNSSRVIVTEYSNLLCIGGSMETSIISINEKISLFNHYLYFTLQKLSCTGKSCGIDITFSDDCRGIDSSKYSHLSFPADSCQTFANDFGAGTPVFQFVSKAAYEIFPQGTVDGLFATALQFKCCQNDNSLLIYNYSNTNCDSTNSEYNTLRLSNEFNGTCFALGNTQKPFDISTGKSSGNDININGEYVYALKYTWTCDEYVDCTGIDFIDNTEIPDLCPDQCLEPGYIFPPSSNPTPSPTAAPTFHPVSRNGQNTASPHNIQGSHPLSGLSKLILIGLVVFVIVLVAVGVIGFCVYNRRKMKRVVEESKQNQINKKDSRYEPMITSQDYVNTVAVALPEGNDQTETVKDDDDASSGQYVLPSKLTTDGGDTNDDASLLTET